MAEINQKVLAMVQREMEKDPSVRNEALLAKAVGIDRSLRKMSGQQFHGTYRLTAARALASKGGSRKKRAVAKRGRGVAAAAGRTTAGRKKSVGRKRARSVATAKKQPGRSNRPKRARQTRSAPSPVTGSTAAAALPVPSARRDSTSGRSAVRAAMLDFAGAIAAAESKVELIDLLGSIDRHVDRVLAAASS